MVRMPDESSRPLVLIVDDYPDAREMYGAYLSLAGFDITQASNGVEALQHALDRPPDLILMDLSLPVMDGLEATRRLKADPRTSAIPVVGLSGHGIEGISADATAAGCVCFVAKPCLPEDVLAQIRRVLGARAAGVPDGRSSAGSRPART
jgi:CheY-like chemotaxis protein